MEINMRCEICDVAFSMNMSEKQFYAKFDFHERAQILATHRSQGRRRALVDQSRRG